MGFILVFPSGVCLKSQLMLNTAMLLPQYWAPEAASPVSGRARVQQTHWVLWLLVLSADLAAVLSFLRHPEGL